MCYNKSYMNVVSLCLRTWYCTVPTLLVVMSEDTMPTCSDAWRRTTYALQCSDRLLQRLLEHKHCHTTGGKLIIRKDTKGLRGRECAQRGYIGQRDDSCPGRREWDSMRFHRATLVVHSLKLMNCLFLEVFM